MLLISHWRSQDFWMEGEDVIQSESGAHFNASLHLITLLKEWFHDHKIFCTEMDIEDIDMTVRKKIARSIVMIFTFL
jgi:hypothetical protein